MKKFLLLLALLGLATPAAAQNPFSLINFGSTAVDTNGGNKSAGTLRVTLATDGTNPTTVFKIDLSGTGANATAIKVDGSAVTQPVSGTFWQATQPVSIASLPSGAVTNAGTFAVQAAESGTWNITNVSGTVSLPTGASTAAKQPALGSAGSASADVITVQGIASMTALKVDGSGVTQPISGSVTATQATGTNLHMVCDSGCSSSTAPADEATFTFGTTPHSPVGGVFQTTATSNALTTGQMGAFQVTANRALFTNLRNAAGTEVGTSTTPLSVTLANTGANATAVKVDGSAVTQPVSGTVTTTPPSNASTNVAQLAGTTTDTNSGNKSAGTLRVVLATDQPALTNKLLVTPDSVALPANQSVNVSQINGVTTSMNTGSPDTGTIRVIPADGVSECSIVSAASTNATNCKAGAGNFVGLELYNTTTTVYYLRLYNTVGAPTCSSATGFIRSIPVPPAGAAGQVGGAIVPIGAGVAYGTGIAFCLTGGSSSTDNTNAAVGIFGAIKYR